MKQKASAYIGANISGIPKNYTTQQIISSSNFDDTVSYTVPKDGFAVIRVNNQYAKAGKVSVKLNVDDIVVDICNDYFPSAPTDYTAGLVVSAAVKTGQVLKLVKVDPGSAISGNVHGYYFSDQSKLYIPS